MHRRCRPLDPPDALTKLRKKDALRGGHARSICSQSCSIFVLILIFVNSKSRQPIREAARRFGNLLGRAGERKADPSPAVDRVEIEAGGHRDPGLDQETVTKLLAVAGYARNIGIKVKCPFGRGKAGKPGSRKRAD